MHQANSAAAAQAHQTSENANESDPPSQATQRQTSPTAPLWTGLYLREQRQRCHLTQRELARLVGCHAHTLANWETGRRRVPHMLSERLLSIFEAEAAREADYRARLHALRSPLHPGE